VGVAVPLAVGEACPAGVVRASRARCIEAPSANDAQAIARTTPADVEAVTMLRRRRSLAAARV
jgi:hypothetical protein